MKQNHSENISDRTSEYPLLEKINSPEDLRKLPLDDLPLVRFEDDEIITT